MTTRTKVAVGALLTLVVLALAGYSKLRGSTVPGALPATSAMLGWTAGAAPGPSPLAEGLSLTAGATPSDDPADWPVDASVEWTPVVSPPLWVIPSPALPSGTAALRSNNNVALAFHDGRLFLAWRSAPTHFASPEARLHVVSSPDLGATWDFERSLTLGKDVREPTLLSIGGRLLLHFFEAGTSPLSFAPARFLRSERLGPARWTAPEVAGAPGLVPWDLKARGGIAFMTAYRGNHYDLLGASAIEALLLRSPDGLAWTPVDPERPVVYRGGVSEVAIEFDAQGGIVAVGRNEDGDATGFGSVLASATAGALAAWRLPETSDPERYDSPRIFRHGKDMYLLARRDPGGPYGAGLSSLPLALRRVALMADYSARPKRTALYALDAAAGKVTPIVDLPSAGDTAFPAVCRVDAHTFLVANYTSPPADADRSWIRGQVSDDGTQIYLATIRFVPR